jgi:hypothetical protein
VGVLRHLLLRRRIDNGAPRPPTSVDVMLLRPSHTINLDIARTADDVYDYLAEPLNFPSWAAVTGPMEQVGPLEWKTETAFGPRFIRFSPRNEWNILDHAVFAMGEEPVVLPMWVVPNAGGCVLIFVFYRRDAMTDDQYRSALEWIRTDFLTLRSLLES